MTISPTVILTGPTATGKTDLALALARYFDTPVISADARQCYKYLDIGTAKPSRTVLEEIPHYHISTLYPDEAFTAADFARKCGEWSRNITRQNKAVLIAGGSTLYIESLIRPLDPLPPKNPDNLRELREFADRQGLEAVRYKLQQVDPDYAARIDGLNPHRMFRALDVWMQTGQPLSSFHHNRPFSLPENTLLICLYRDRNELHERINSRVEQMLSRGLLQEVRHILDMGYDPGLQSLQTVGYRESIAHIQEKMTREALRDKIKTHTRRYARRQLTWFRRWNGAQWINQSEQSGKSIKDALIQQVEQLADQS